MTDKKRSSHLDIFRGIAILLILIGHTFWSKWISNVIFSFHLPLFLLFTGFMINGSVERYDLKEFVKRKFGTIMRPYYIALIFSLASYLIFDVQTGFMTLNNRLEGFWNVIINANSYSLGINYYSIYFWFLPPFFLFSILLFVIFKYYKKYLKEIFAGLITISIVIVYFASFKIYDSNQVPWGVDKLPLMLSTGIIGYLLKIGIKKIENKRKVVTIITGTILICTAGFFVYDMRIMYYASLLQYYFYAIVGFIFTYNISHYINKHDGDPFRDLLIYCGKNSLGIYIAHAFVYYWLHSAMGSPTTFHLFFNISAVLVTLSFYRTLQGLDYYLDKFAEKGQNNQETD